MITEPQAAELAMRLSGLPKFPATKAGVLEIVKALSKASESFAHADSMIEDFLRSSRRAPTPADIYELAARTRPSAWEFELTPSESCAESGEYERLVASGTCPMCRGKKVFHDRTCIGCKGSGQWSRPDPEVFRPKLRRRGNAAADSPVIDLPRESYS
jgi:hypothetical protein